MAETERESRLRLVVGLGNPGARYAGTRHNLGFRVCDGLCAVLGLRLEREKFDALMAETWTPGGKVVVLEPQTFMNQSGLAVAAAAGFYRLELADLLVVCDDFNLALGQLRLRRGGSHGGHNGLRDIIQALGDERFPRLRLGTGPLDGADSVGFCLSRFGAAEKAQVEAMIDRAVEATQVWLASGMDAAMNQFNTKAPENP